MAFKLPKRQLFSIKFNGYTACGTSILFGTIHWLNKFHL